MFDDKGSAISEAPHAQQIIKMKIDGAKKNFMLRKKVD